MGCISVRVHVSVQAASGSYFTQFRMSVDQLLAASSEKRDRSHSSWGCLQSSLHFLCFFSNLIPPWPTHGGDIMTETTWKQQLTANLRRYQPMLNFKPHSLCRSVYKRFSFRAPHKAARCGENVDKQKKYEKSKLQKTRNTLSAWVYDFINIPDGSRDRFKKKKIKLSFQW